MILLYRWALIPTISKDFTPQVFNLHFTNSYHNCREKYDFSYIPMVANEIDISLHYNTL